MGKESIGEDMYESIRAKLLDHITKPGEIGNLVITEEERNFLLDWVKKVNGFRVLTGVEALILLDNIKGSSSSASVSPY